MRKPEEGPRIPPSQSAAMTLTSRRLTLQSEAAITLICLVEEFMVSMPLYPKCNVLPISCFASF